MLTLLDTEMCFGLNSISLHWPKCLQRAPTVFMPEKKNITLKMKKKNGEGKVHTLDSITMWLLVVDQNKHN